MTSLGARISEYRRRKNITQDQLSEIMGVSSQAVSKWENDISCPDISMLPKLSDYFGVSIDMLLRGEENKVFLLEPNQRKSIDQMVLRLAVNSADGDIVNINLPLGLIKAGLGIGAPFLQMNGRGAVNESLKDIDFTEIIRFAESGLIGKFLDVKSANGDTVEIFIS